MPPTQWTVCRRLASRRGRRRPRRPVFDGATCLACAAIIWRFVPPGTEPPRAGDEPGRLRDVLADRLMVVFCLVVALQATVYMQSFSTLPLAMSEDGLGPSERRGDRAQRCADRGAAATRTAAPRATAPPRRAGRRRRADRARVGIEGLTPTLIAYALPVVIWTAGEILVTSVAPATVADLAPAHLRARYQAVFGTAFNGAFIVAPPPARCCSTRPVAGRCGAPAARSASRRR